MKIKYLILLTLSGFVVSLDQVTKLWVNSELKLGTTASFIEGFLSITLQRNTAGVFAIFQNLDPHIRTLFFLLVPFISIVGILCAFIFLKNLSQLFYCGLALIAGGALGNLLDRLRFNSVIGFLEFHWLPRRHPLNLADIFLIVGGLILIFCISFSHIREEKT
ncbi:MAG: signal peptidase II [Deltaproteobacteria bacterium]|nr:signal peptidase II [Deltaproteobacteria bacterium]